MNVEDTNMREVQSDSHEPGHVSLRQMTRGDHSLVDALLADAFAESPITRMVVGEGDVRSRIARLNRSAVRAKESNGTIVELNGTPAGVMIEADSPRCEPSGLASLRFLFDALLATRTRFALAGGLSREASKNHPEWPHRHLVVLGVRPEFQGNGVGSALLKRFCDEADASGKAGYLETDSDGGKRLYERFGFREVNRTTKDGLNFIYMWRDAKRPG